LDTVASWIAWTACCFPSCSPTTTRPCSVAEVSMAIPEPLITAAAFIVALAVLVFVHELGHFLTAKRLGVKVLRFSIGFGPVIWRRQRGETEYAISAIPLGGYVKMLG